MKAKLSELRDLLSIVINEKAAGAGASSAEIAAEFIKRHKDLLPLHVDEFTRIAVMQMINEVSRRKPPRSVIPGQSDLFGYAGPQAVAVKSGVGTQKIRRNVFDLTIEEATEWISEHKLTKQRQAQDAVEIDNLVERARPFCKGQMTIREGLLAAQEAEQKGDK